MGFESSEKADVVVIGAGPAGVFAVLRAADLGARTVLHRSAGQQRIRWHGCQRRTCSGSYAGTPELKNRRRRIEGGPQTLVEQGEGETLLLLLCLRAQLASG